MKKIHYFIFLVMLIFLNAQDEKWKSFRKNTEEGVVKGQISRLQADNLYSGYRLKFDRKDYRLEKHNQVLQAHFKKLGVSNLGYIKNNLFDVGINPDQMEAVLGGLLRLAQAVKIEGTSFKINPKIESYFKVRLRLENTQVKILIDIAKNLGNSEPSQED